MIMPSRNQSRRFYRASSANVTGRKLNSEQKIGVYRTSQLANTDRKQRNVSCKNARNNLLGFGNLQKGKFKRQSVRSTYREIEELFQENTILKKQNHKLNQDLVQIKGRVDSKYKKKAQISKQLDIEYQKQIYWNGNKSYMISGIKFQYQKLKKKYYEQEQMITQLKRVIKQSKIEQYQILAEALETQNKRLVQLLKKKQEKCPTKTPTINYQEKYHKSQQFNQQLSKKNKIIQSQIKQAQQKMVFLERLLIEKDKENYQIKRRIKKTDRLVNQLKQQNIKLTDEIALLNRTIENEKNKIRIKMQEQKQELKVNMKKQINQMRIKLEYVTEEKKELEYHIIKLKKGVNNLRRNTIGSNSNLLNTGSLNSFYKIDNQGNEPLKLVASKKNIKIPQIESNQGFTSLDKDEEQQQEKRQKRKEAYKNRRMITSKQKHSDEAKKLRKVQYLQIVEIAQLIKYRAVSQGITSDELKKYFDKVICPSDQLLLKTVQSDTQKLNEQQLEWQQEHISMGEVKDVLKAHPFNLQDGLASVLARYVIEDSNDEYAYCDDKNQNKREIVKSIIKATVGSYSLPTQKQKEQLQQFRQKYLTNLHSALKIYYPSGKISKKKFIQVMNGMGIKISDECLELVLAKILGKSCGGLNQLMYGCLSEI